MTLLVSQLYVVNRRETKILVIVRAGTGTKKSTAIYLKPNRLCSVRWWVDWWIINLERLGRCPIWSIRREFACSDTGKSWNKVVIAGVPTKIRTECPYNRRIQRYCQTTLFMWTKREPNSSPPHPAKVKNAWSFTSVITTISSVMI
jgi:hypothetical protein